MRRIVLISMLCACALSAFAYNEQVAAIAYNPSRLGVYKQLRVTKTATLQGGANVTEEGSMNIESNVTLKDETNKCESGSGKCDKANLNQITTIAPDGEGTTSTSAQVSGTLQRYKENGVYFGSYSIASKPSADQGTQVNVLGGALTATGDSYIDNFKSNTVSKLTVTANELSVGTDTASAVFGTTDSLKLGGIKVNKSTCPGGECKGYQWVDRMPDGATEAVKVLAVKVN
ncbi:MAG: hypothetical protein II913_01015 [Elusimicrobiaceae bacterium]|nr:hypothetical protein [Elusimicrobiaceae bacterium]